MKKTPLVVFVFPTERTPGSTRYGGFASRLHKYGGLQGCETLTAALENLAFIIEEDGNAQVIDVPTGTDLGAADFVYLKSWESMPEEASALTNFLRHKGVPCIDSLPIGVGVSKLAASFRLWGAGIPMPLSLYVRRHDRLQQCLADGWAEKLGEQFIVKDILAEKGKNNFYVPAEAVAGLLAEHPTAPFVCQRFVPNDGDYRIGVYGGVARFAITRLSGGQSHLNNTSAGGTAVFMPIADVPEALRALAEQAAAACGLQISGVDIIIDRITQQPFILEANQGSQIVTGAFREENMTAFVAALHDMIHQHKTIIEPPSKPLQIIGRRAHMALPDLGIADLVAKVDTGAYSSSLHAKHIHTEQAADGTTELVFEVVPSEYTHFTGSSPIIRTRDFSKNSIISSSGHKEERYSIRTTFAIAGQVFPALLYLTDRSQMRYPLLMGRNALRSHFVVNVELNEDGEALTRQFRLHHARRK